MKAEMKRALVRGGRTFLWFFITFLIMNFAGIGETLEQIVPAVYFPAVFAVILSFVMAAEKMFRDEKAKRREAKSSAGFQARNGAGNVSQGQPWDSEAMQKYIQHLAGVVEVMKAKEADNGQASGQE